MIFLPEQEPLTHFRRALRRSDQLILDDLLAAVQRYQAAAVYATQALPVENLLLALLIEEHKEVERLRNQVDALQSRQVDLPALPYD
jgi:hypothetical protein